jgi:hypothetical protein
MAARRLARRGADFVLDKQVEADGKVTVTFRCLRKYLRILDGGRWANDWAADDVNRHRRRKPASEQDWTATEWAWSWPANRRMLYNTQRRRQAPARGVDQAGSG